MNAPEITNQNQEKNVIGDLLKYAELFKKAEKLYREDEEQVQSWTTKKDRDAAYFLTMIKKGTMADRVNALQMLIGKSPTRALGYLKQLMTLARQKNRKQAESAYFGLKEVFTKHLLQDNKKLTSFQHNASINGVKESEIANFDLIEAYYDHCIKELYREYVNEILQSLTKDDLEYFRKQALTILVDLISSKPEIEELILSIVVNKLGDLSKKVQ